MRGKKKQPRNRVFLVAYGADGRVLEKDEMTYDHYYDEEHSLIDDDEYRSQLGVRKVTGEVYNSSGERTQRFEIEYDEEGHYLRARTEYSDGTVVDD